MKTEESYQILGQVTYSFGRIDFWLAHIAKDFGIVDEYQEFYAKKEF